MANSLSSILVNVDSRFNTSKTFWNQIDHDWDKDIAQNKLFEGPLNISKAQGQLKKRFFVLTRLYVYYWKTISDSAPTRCCKITWRRVEAFSEDSINEERFGFRICRGDLACDFYTSDADELDLWLSQLCKVAIMVDIEDDFIFDRELGKGNYAVVKLAVSQEDGHQYAVKIISQDVLIESSRATEAIVNEVSILRKLDHPRIVKLVRLYESTENLYLVLDYVSGGELFKRILARKSFSEQSASIFMKNLLETLSYIHSKNIVHRDIKPENILMVSSEEDTDFKIADFGLATECSYSMTLRCGSPGYVAPEILRKTAYNTKVDVFSAGVILYILLSGRTPFYGKSPNEILARNKECRFYFNEKYWGKISRQGIDLVLKLTSTDPSQRPNAEEALKHPWFYKIHDKTVPLNIAVSPSSKIPLASPGEAHISHNFMERVNRLRVPAPNTYFASLFGAQKEEKEEEAKVNLGIRRISPVRRDLAQKLFSGLREFDPSIKVVAKPTPKETPPKLDTFSSLEISDSAKIESPSSAINQEGPDAPNSKK